MNMECEVVCYIGLLTVLFACKRPRGSQGLAPGLSLPIMLTLLSMIIDNENAGSKYRHNLDN
jgi:hypothetical protein